MSAEKNDVERRAVLDLREEISARSKRDFHFVAGLMFVLLRDVFQRKLQVGSGSDPKRCALLCVKCRECCQ